MSKGSIIILIKDLSMVLPKKLLHFLMYRTKS